ncbi:MAG: carboxymuconolactone decarboxylase family protein [Spirochaetes bacterium]|nr:carboxymuconolactone decarboxylase family protein [Spirochaetota bacterium]
MFIIRNISAYRRAFRNREISRSFAEKIMLVVTSVNGCRYCAWFHAKQALSSGMNTEEIRSMLDLQFHTSAADNEVPALLYAQNYAETGRNPDRDVSDRLIEYYGEKTASDIILYIRAIFFGNLTGNTFDAFLARFKGEKAENSNLFFELIFFLINFPVLFPVLFLMRKKQVTVKS